MKSLLFTTIFLLCAFQALTSFQSTNSFTNNVGPITDIEKNPMLKDLFEFGKTQFIRKYNIENGLSFAPNASTTLQAMHASSQLKGFKVTYEVKMQDLKGAYHNVTLNVLSQPWKDFKGLESFSIN